MTAGNTMKIQNNLWADFLLGKNTDCEISIYFTTQLFLIDHRLRITIRHKQLVLLFTQIVYNLYLYKQLVFFWYRNVPCFELRWGGALPRFSVGFVKWLSFERLSSLSYCISLCLRMELNATAWWLWEKGLIWQWSTAPQKLIGWDCLMFLVLILVECSVFFNLDELAPAGILFSRLSCFWKVIVFRFLELH